jgi:hypothetical protein
MHGVPTKETTSQQWLMFSKLWSCYNEAQKDPDEANIIQMNEVFPNCSEEDKIYPLTVKEIIKAQKADNKLKHFFNSSTSKSVLAGTKYSC